ncbi:MAG: hypothetical protein RL637_148 [Pseudomonadota bacterium]|jgi:FkbM family methyltransferase
MNSIYWPLKIKNDVIVCVQPFIQQMTSYILLEQEDWFEDEMSFVRKYITPEMNVLDIGANHGVYALTIAKKLTTGHVWAFEPTLSPGSLLAKSIELNHFTEKVTWIHAGLSDHSHQAEIAISMNSELNSLYAKSEINEKIQLLALDSFWQSKSLSVAIDFVKLDAEGEEINVLKGGQDFFNHQSPLLMFELKHGNVINQGLIEAIQNLGYQIYRLLPDINILVDYETSFYDGYLLNLFACKSDRAAKLIKSGLLAPKSEIKKLSASQCIIQLDWQQRLQKTSFTNSELFNIWQSNLSNIPKAYLAALSINLQLYDTQIFAIQKVFLLETATKLVEDLFKKFTNQPEILLLKIHLLHVQGYRAESVKWVQQLIKQLSLKEHHWIWPFIPPSQPFFSYRSQQSSVHQWVLTLLQEFHEYRKAFSSYFIKDAFNNLRHLLNNQNVGQAINRRLLLASYRSNQPLNIVAEHSLLNPTLSKNAPIWHQIVYGIGSILFNQESPIHILDIGASTHGKLTEPYAPLMQMGLAKVTGFEPNQIECQKLNDMYDQSRQYRYYSEFVGSGNKATFYETNWFMTGSLYRPNTDLLDQFEQLGEVVQLKAEHEINTVRISDLPSLDEIDMIKIDVQGAELEVFKGAGQRLTEALVIWTGVEFIPLYEKQPLFSEVEQYLRQHGFMFHAFNGIAVRGYKPYCQLVKKRQGMKQAIWSDAIFIKNIHSLKNLSSIKLKKLAVLLDCVIHSYDLCFLVLKILDEREQTKLALQYLHKHSSDFN